MAKYKDLITAQEQAAFLDDKRNRLIAWMRGQGYSQEAIDVELRRLDELIAVKLSGARTLDVRGLLGDM